MPANRRLTMISRYLTDVRVQFNPFSKRTKVARIFLTLLPANAHQTMKITKTVIPMDKPERAALFLQFSTLPCPQF